MDDQAQMSQQREAGRMGGLARAAKLGKEERRAMSLRMLAIRYAGHVYKTPPPSGRKRGRPRKVKTEIIGGGLPP